VCPVVAQSVLHRIVRVVLELRYRRLGVCFRHGVLIARFAVGELLLVPQADWFRQRVRVDEDDLCRRQVWRTAVAHHNDESV
jgi:hypothetical protein